MMAHTVKPLEWRQGPVSQYNHKVNFDVATTPFGDYTVWYQDNSLWTPQKAEASRHSTLALAKIAAYDHLCECVAGVLS